MGGLTFGLTMRYLGIALGMAVALGYTAVFGTLVPPIFHGTLGQTLGSASGKFVLLGVLASVAGIAVSGMAGMSKERELTGEQKQSAITEFHFGKGMLIATFSGIMSSCFAFALDAGTPVTDAAKASLLAHGDVGHLAGPAGTDYHPAGWLHDQFYLVRAAERPQQVGRGICRAVQSRDPHCRWTPSAAEVSATEAVSPWPPTPASGGTATRRLCRRDGRRGVPLLNNYMFAALAGIIWYLQFFFYTMGQAKMGKAFAFSNWTLHMASIMIFSMLWGVALKEWAGTSKRTHALIALGLALLVGSTLIIGYGNFLDTHPGH